MEQIKLVSYFKRLDKQLNEIHDIIRKLEPYEIENVYDFSNNMDKYEYDEVESMYRESLKGEIESIVTKIKYVFDRLGCCKCYDEFTKEMKEYEGKLGELGFIPEVDTVYSQPLGIVNKYYEAIKAEIDESDNGDNYENKMLLKMLKATPFIINKENAMPEKEKDVKDIIFKYLKVAFPDANREFTIMHSAKVFKPDIGIKTLKTAIEYKYCNSEEEFKNALDGIFTDIHGYSGSKDWLNFIGIIFCTNNFTNQEIVDSMCISANVPNNWNIQVVFGHGKRK